MLFQIDNNIVSDYHLSDTVVTNADDVVVVVTVVTVVTVVVAVIAVSSKYIFLF
jgi:hypothetical protein